MTDEIEKLRKAVSAGHFEPSSGGHSLLTHCPECGRKLTIVTDEKMGFLSLYLSFSSSLYFVYTHLPLSPQKTQRVRKVI